MTQGGVSVGPVSPNPRDACVGATRTTRSSKLRSTKGQVDDRCRVVIEGDGKVDG